MSLNKIQQRAKRHRRIRGKISGTKDRPRLVVFKSLKKNYAQLIDDDKHIVLASASDASFKEKETKTIRANRVGKELAKIAIEKGITTCVFDRNGYKYHGRAKALAEGAREAGLKF